MTSAARPNPINDIALLTEPEKAAVLMLSLGDEAASIWASLDEDEIKEVSALMSTLGKVTPAVVEQVVIAFIRDLSVSGAVIGDFDATYRLLSSFLPADKVEAVMEEIRGPAGRTMWDKLGNVNEAVLASYLKNEYPQTVAVVLSKIKTEHAARVLGELPDEFAIECIARMLRMEPVQRDILDKIEVTLRTEFMSNLARTSKRDSHEMMAEIFNRFDRQTEQRFMSALEQRNRESADRIRQLMFVFEDLKKLDAAGFQTLIRVADKADMAMALKGSSDELRTKFMSSMSERAAKLLREEMASLGPVRLKDVDAAQARIVITAKDLAARGEIVIAEGGGDDEMIY